MSHSAASANDRKEVLTVQEKKRFIFAGNEKRTINTVQRDKAIHAFISVFRAFFLICVCYIILYPLLYMVSNAFKPLEQAVDPSVVWIPKAFTLENFRTAWAGLDFGNSVWMTLYVSMVSAFLEVAVCCFIAYGFARFRFKERNFLFMLVMLTIIIPPQAIVVPTYMNFYQLGILNTPFTFYLPSILGVGLRSGLFIFIYRQFFRGLPQELEEAAWVDGAGPLRTFLQIIVPSSGVAILTVTIFAIVWHWNDYHLASMYFDEQYPLAVSLVQIRSGLQASANINSGANASEIRPVLMAACLMFITPVLILYLFLQKYFIRSIERVGIVG